MTYRIFDDCTFQPTGTYQKELWIGRITGFTYIMDKEEKRPNLFAKVSWYHAQKRSKELIFEPENNDITPIQYFSFLSFFFLFFSHQSFFHFPIIFIRSINKKIEISNAVSKQNWWCAKQRIGQQEQPFDPKETQRARSNNFHSSRSFSFLFSFLFSLLFMSIKIELSRRIDIFRGPIEIWNGKTVFISLYYDDFGSFSTRGKSLGGFYLSILNQTTKVAFQIYLSFPLALP